MSAALPLPRASSSRHQSPSAFAQGMNFVPIFCRLSMPAAGMMSASAGIGGCFGKRATPRRSR